ncbi:MAG: quinoprotein relay system zinc metallohydrolase 1 [Hyphomicrobiaceae bacterium]|nr:quinoprotein relay system zinc metallohydrolase 1 [Hyphomicrobiaceae bacterium]
MTARSETIDRRRFLLRTGTALGTLSLATLLPAFHSSAAPLRYDLRPVALADGVWVVHGAQETMTRQNGGAIANIGIIATRDGAVVIDTGPSRRYGEELAALAVHLTGKPVVRAYLTHIHPDHVFGNQAFASGALAATQSVADVLGKLGEGFASAMYHSAGDWMRGTELVLPATILTGTSEEIGGRRFQLLALDGHTASDLVVLDERSGTVFAGDLAFLDRAPTTPHATIPRWHASLTVLRGLAASRLVPGHGPVEAGARAIDQTSAWLAMLEERIGMAFDRGLTMTEAFAEPLPAWTDRIALARYEYERSVMHMLPKLESSRWPRVDRAD